jgi:hypothetical protein
MKIITAAPLVRPGTSGRQQPGATRRPSRTRSGNAVGDQASSLRPFAGIDVRTVLDAGRISAEVVRAKENDPARRGER